jgi:hypothetical protein
MRLAYDKSGYAQYYEEVPDKVGLNVRELCSTLLRR